MFMGVITFIATYVILSRDEKEKNESFDLSMEKAGIPDQIERKEPTETENANMVSEGSQFGVQYYNHLPESKKEELQERSEERRVGKENRCRYAANKKRRT